jgi:hypothetical protein
VKVRLVTFAASAALVLCLAAWVRSYLPEYSTVRAHRGSLVLLFYNRDTAVFIDPANNPALDGTRSPLRRWDTEQVLADARRWADRNTWTAKPPSWRGLGFELIFNHHNLSQGYFLAAVPFWFIALLPAGTAAWGATRWARQAKWRRENRCRRCGYDLRDSRAACPECGTPVTPAQPSPVPPA